MPSFRSNLPAAQVDSCLRTALKELEDAEHNAVLWFAEVHGRKLYLELGYSSVQQYAAEALGFSRSKMYQFIRLSEALKSLPVLKQAVRTGDVAWTTAREVAKVATPRTEKRWVSRARATSRRELVQTVARAKAKAAAVRNGSEQAAIGLLEEPLPVAPVEVPVDLHVRFTPEQYARYEALVEKLRKEGVNAGREELLLCALEEMVARQSQTGRGGSSAAENRQDSERCTRVHSTPVYQVVVQQCESCGRGSVSTSRGEMTLATAALQAILCDARVQRNQEKNRAAIPPRVRRRVLARDRYRCRASGCGSARFLAVHHLVPRETGGSNDPDNLITLCSGCHRILHRAPLEKTAIRLLRGMKGVGNRQ